MIKHKFILLFFACFALATTATAQNSFTINQTDTSAFPELKATVLVKAGEKPQKADFKVIEQDTPLEFTMNLVEEKEGNKQIAIFFLIENTGNTKGKALNDIKTGLSEALLTFNGSQMLNLGTFGRAQSNGNAFNALSIEYTADSRSLSSSVSGINAVKDTSTRSDVFKGIDECLDYINGRVGLPANKILIVLSAGVNNSKSPIKADDVILKSKQTGIPVYSLIYPSYNRYAGDNLKRISDNTKGLSRTVTSSSDVSNYVQDYVENFTKKAGQTIQCELLFKTTAEADGKEHKVDIDYKGTRLTAIFNAPKGGEGFLSLTLYIVIAVLIIALIVFSIFMAILAKRKRDARKATEEKRFKEMEQKNQRTQEETKRRQLTDPGTSHKADLKKTVISGTTQNPTLNVYLGNDKQTYNLKPTQITVGRAATNNIVVADQTISSNHALFTYEGGQYVLTDLNSTNGSFVNGKRITKQPLKNGDLIRMGAIEMKFSL